MKDKEIGYLFIAIGVIIMGGAFLLSSVMDTNPVTEDKTDVVEKSGKKSKNKTVIREHENGEVSLDTESSEDISIGDFDKVSIFHYDEVEKNVLESVKKNNYSYYLLNCEGSMPDVTTTFKELKESSFPKVMSKLRACNRYESNVTASFFCPKYSYSIGIKSKDSIHPKIFSLNYANDSKVLLVGYNNVGYAFYFDEDVTGFIESLQ